MPEEIERVFSRQVSIHANHVQNRTVVERDPSATIQDHHALTHCLKKRLRFLEALSKILLRGGKTTGHSVDSA
ncbi:hypothetical protein D3C83_89070 [compost metagenome]